MTTCRKCGFVDLAPGESNIGPRFYEKNIYTVDDEGFLRWMGKRGRVAQEQEVARMKREPRLRSSFTAVPGPRSMSRRPVAKRDGPLVGKVPA